MWAAGGIGRRTKICLRRILRIRWQQKMTNRRVVEMAGTDEISCQVQRRRWNWLGNILRREGMNDCFAALGRTPEGQTAGGRPKITWRRAVKRKRGKAGCKSWNVAKAAACDWGGWADNVTTLRIYWCKLVMRILATVPFIGEKATKGEVLKQLSTVALVHIAAHGEMETGEILLAPNPARESHHPEKKDFLLTMADVLEAKLRARLVVLSCCHSARGEIKAEGVVGIA